MKIPSLPNIHTNVILKSGVLVLFPPKFFFQIFFILVLLKEKTNCKLLWQWDISCWYFHFFLHLAGSLNYNIREQLLSTLPVSMTLHVTLICCHNFCYSFFQRATGWQRAWAEIIPVVRGFCTQPILPPTRRLCFHPLHSAQRLDWLYCALNSSWI